MAYLLIIFFAYLLGSSSMSYYLAKFKKVDIRRQGSKNLGASNAMILMGWKAGIIVALHDIFKAVIAALLAAYFFPHLAYVKEVAGVACVIGHIFPFYLHFKGGKGFAAYIGMTIALNWKIALVIMALIVIITLITDYIVCGTLTTVTLVPITLAYLANDIYLALILAIASFLIIYKHRENIVRIINGQEIGLRAASGGKYRR